MDLLEFDRELKKLDIEDMARPFVCEGSPLDCNTFLVGHNSATEGLFWDFWDPENKGFKKEAWYKQFSKSTDINRRVTRRRIELMFNEFSSSNIKLLQTNLYCFPSGSKSELSDIHKKSNVLNFLLNSIQPEAIIGHGKEICTYLWNLNGSGFIKNEWFNAEIFNFSTKIYCRDHLSIRENSHGKTKDLAQKLKNHLSREFSR